TRSSTATTTVLSILSLTTRPSRILRYLRVSVFCSVIAGLLRGLLGQHDDAELALPHHGVDAGDLPLHFAQPSVRLELARRSLEAEVEQLLLGLLQLGDQFFLRLRPQIVGGKALRSHHASPTSRFTNLHFIGSLCIARRSASRASGSGTPASSN